MRDWRGGFIAARSSFFFCGIFAAEFSSVVPRQVHVDAFVCLAGYCSFASLLGDFYQGLEMLWEPVPYCISVGFRH